MPEPTAAVPDAFVWGVATSSYQIEGAVRDDGRGESIWDRFCRTPGKVRGGDTGDVACDHYHRWEADLDLIRELGVDAYRFSIAWPRVVPDGSGPVNPRGLDHYDRLVDGLLERGLTPYPTLYHWDLPQALQDRGGWAERGTADAFARYAGIVAERLGDRVRRVATLNEPWVVAHLGHATGEHAPGVQHLATSLRVGHHLLLGHGRAAAAWRAARPDAEVGIVLNLTVAHPATDGPEDAAAARTLDGMLNRWYLDPLLRGRYPEDLEEAYGDAAPESREGDLAEIRAPLDWLGVNYYTRSLVRHAPEAPWPRLRAAPPEGAITDMGWEVYPDGLRELLVRLGRDYDAPPLVVTENGAAFPDPARAGPDGVDDAPRVRYLREHLAALEAARAEGADVRGYFAWSLLDNFEWAEGYAKRFGLVHVDYDTQRRSLKRSAEWYREHVARARAGAAAR